MIRAGGRHFFMMKAMLLFVNIALHGCQSSPVEQFSVVREGMQKDVVLDQAGGPNVTRRWHGKDRWIYNFKNSPNGPQTREVHFEDGRAVYVGPKVVPVISANEQDRLNERSNVEETKKATAEHLQWADEHGVAYKPKTGIQLDADDIRLQQSMYGTQDLKRERTKIAPSFQEIN